MSRKGPFNETFTVYSLATIGRDDLEFGDKIILPSDTFKEVLYLKLQFPLHFEVKSVKKPGVNEKPFPVQYCGVLEFSAKIGNAYLPQWMMQNLRLKNKDKVNVLAPSTSIPLGQYCKLQPHTEAFFDLLQEMGPRNLLESAMRGYSVLSAGERLIIQANGESHSVNVVQVKPGSCVSILGCLDLEVDIATPLDFKPKPGGPRPAAVDNTNGFGEVDGFGDPVPSDPALFTPLPSSSFGDPVPAASVAAPVSTASSSSGPIPSLPRRRYLSEQFASLAEQPAPPPPIAPAAASVEVEQSDAQVPAGTVSTNEQGESVTMCGTCRKWIGTANVGTHSLHCARNSVKCPTCSAMVKRTELAAHQAAMHQQAQCSLCQVDLPPHLLVYHQQWQCDRRPLACVLCGSEGIAADELEAHESHCGQQAEHCEACGRDYSRFDFDSHECKPKCVCGERIDREQWDEHQLYACSMRKATCPYCHLPIPSKEQDSHVQRCGGRTEPCITCGRFIRLRDMQQHENSGCAYPPLQTEPEIAPVLDVPMEPLSCPICFEQFQHLDEAQEHVVLQHASGDDEADLQGEVGAAIETLMTKETERTEQHAKEVDRLTRAAALKAVSKKAPSHPGMVEEPSFWRRMSGIDGQKRSRETASAGSTHSATVTAPVSRGARVPTVVQPSLQPRSSIPRPPPVFGSAAPAPSSAGVSRSSMSSTTRPGVPAPRPAPSQRVAIVAPKMAAPARGVPAKAVLRAPAARPAPTRRVNSRYESPEEAMIRAAIEASLVSQTAEQVARMPPPASDDSAFGDF